MKKEVRVLLLPTLPSWLEQALCLPRARHYCSRLQTWTCPCCPGLSLAGLYFTASHLQQMLMLCQLPCSVSVPASPSPGDRPHQVLSVS